MSSKYFESSKKDWSVHFYTPFIIEDRKSPFAAFSAISPPTKEVTLGVMEQIHPIPSRAVALASALDRYERQVVLLEDLLIKCTKSIFDAPKEGIPEEETDPAMIKWKRALASNTYEITGFPTHRPRRLSEESISERERSLLPPADRVIRRPSVSSGNSTSSSFSSPATSASDILGAPSVVPEINFKMSISFLISPEAFSVASLRMGPTAPGDKCGQNPVFGSSVFSDRFDNVIPGTFSKRKPYIKNALFYNDEYFDSDEDKENIAPIAFYY